MSSELKALPLTILENGYWRDIENTIAVFDGFLNLPPVFKNYIDQIDPAKHKVKSKQVLKAPTDTGIIPLYRLTSIINNQAVFKSEVLDAALQYSNPDMYLIGTGYPVIIEHDEGYVLVCSVRIGGDQFWLIEGKETEIKTGDWYEAKTQI